MQGYRIHMEDSHTHILSLPDDPGTSFFAVYDGHGGANIGKYASKHLHKFITKRAEYQAGDIAGAMKKVEECIHSFSIEFLKFDLKIKAKQRCFFIKKCQSIFCYRHSWILMKHCLIQKN